MKKFGLAALLLCAVPVQGQDTPPSGSVEGVWYEEGKFEHEWGVWFKVDFQINNCYGKDCTLLIWLYDQNGNQLKDRNGEYRDDAGGVMTRVDFKPGFQYAKYTKFAAFIPYNELHVAPGSYNLQFRIGLFWRDRSWHDVHRTGFYKYPFTWRLAETGEITKMEIDYNNKSGDKNGLKATINYSVHGMKGKKGRFVFEFYYDRAELATAYRHGRSEEGAMSYSQEFEPGFENTDYTGGWYRVDYSDFPLKIGRNVFFFKVWLQALSGDGKWYTVDATSASEFWVNNGELKLKEVWVMDKFRVLLDWQPSDDEMRTLRDLLTDFNKHMYDVTDGQVRIGAVVFGRMGRHPDHHYDGAFRIYKDFKTGDHGVIGENEKYLLPQFRPWAYLGTPDRPGDSHIAFESLGTYGKDNLARVIAHEFCHAAFGLPDEYEDQKDDKTGRIYSQSLCSKNEALRRAWNACIMSCSNPMYREWCKPDTHAKNTGNARLQADDCYTKAAMAIKKAFGRDLVIPETPVEGPTNPPDPRFSWE